MKKTLSRFVLLAAGAAGLFAASCAYDPYYTDSGYGYSGGSYSTSVFISTGNARWGYDPYCHSYYDYQRRAYYDPFLYGYYPVGYRPPVIYGVPHPHGWHPGSRYCPPPSRISNHTLSNYRDREGSYRRSNFSWSNQVRQRDQGSNFRPDQGPGRNRPDSNRDSQRNNSRPSSDNRPSWNGGNQFTRQQENTRPEFRPQQSNNSDRFRGNDRSSLERSNNFDRSQFNRQRESQRPTPSGFNNPVNLTERREIPQRQTPQFDRSAMRERSTQNSVREFRPSPPQERSSERSSGGSSRREGPSGDNDRGGKYQGRR